MVKEKFNFSKLFVRGELTLGFWSYVKKAVGLGDTFFILKSISLYQYGIYQLLLSYYAILSDIFHNIFSQVVINDIYRFVGTGKESHAKKLFWEYSTFRVITSAIPFIFTFALSSLFGGVYGPEAILWVRLISFLFITDAVISLVLLVLSIRFEFRISASRPTFQKISQFSFLSFFFFFSNLNVTLIIASQLFASVAAIFFMLPAVIRSYRPWLRIKAEKGPIMKQIVFSYGRWEIPQLFLRDLSSKIRPWIIKTFVNTEAVGIFGVASIAVGLLRDIIPVRTLVSLVPRKAHDSSYLHFLYVYGTKYYLLLSIFLIIAGAIGFPVGIYFIFPQFKASIPLFYILLPTISIFAFTKLINIFLLVRRRQKFIFYSSLFQNIATLSFNAGFLYILGIGGLAWGELIGYFVIVAARYYYLVRKRFIKSFPFRRLFTFGKSDTYIISVFKRHLFSSIKGASSILRLKK